MRILVPDLSRASPPARPCCCSSAPRRAPAPTGSSPTPPSATRSSRCGSPSATRWGSRSPRRALDSLGVAHLRLANLGEAGAQLRARARPRARGRDRHRRARQDRPAAGRPRPGREPARGLAAPAADAARDLFHARLRQGRWEQAAALAEDAGQPGRAALLRRLAATDGPWRIEGPERVSLPWIRCWPVPIVKARLNGQPVLLAVETGVADLVLDPSTARRCDVTLLPEQAPLAWGGTQRGRAPGARAATRPGRPADRERAGRHRVAAALEPRGQPRGRGGRGRDRRQPARALHAHARLPQVPARAGAPRRRRAPSRPARSASPSSCGASARSRCTARSPPGAAWPWRSRPACPAAAWAPRPRCSRRSA